MPARIQGAGDLTVREARHDADAERLWINETQYVEPVTAAAWVAQVGGYGVLSLWLRNRRGRRLTGDEARGLACIVASVMAAEFVKAGIDDLVEDVLEGNMLGVGLPDHA